MNLTASGAPLRLTRRELEILHMIVEEHSSPEIAERLFISLNTVETHRRNLFRKTGARSVVGLVSFAFRHGLAK
ncbi:MAG: LuxR C-terminal-related transcriptional regulator [Bernardetiaceae bacterium]|jgi:DNA-binding CsgD family transcriptional regulator|nr:LuxR C-terminal-related transcriptional regulator [Bernardetiaceae bacterium]